MDKLNSDIEVSVRSLKVKKTAIKITKIVILTILLILLITYIIMNVVYNNGNFSITLDKNMYFQRGIIVYDDPDYKVFRTELYAKAVDYFDNIYYKWLPDDLDKKNGSHNGDNYIAYTFYIENTGTDVSDYWYQIIIDDVIKNVDKAVRVRVYKNGKYITYAKIGMNGKPEKDTTPFVNSELVAFEHREKFSPGDIDKFTVVIWVEGTDIDCTDNLLGGEIKMHMEFNSEFKEVDANKFNKEKD